MDKLTGGDAPLALECNNALPALSARAVAEADAKLTPPPHPGGCGARCGSDAQPPLLDAGWLPGLATGENRQAHRVTSMKIRP